MVDNILKFKFDSKILSSSHINFLFGAGINGSAFPKLIEFTETISILEHEIREKVKNFEESVAVLSVDQQEIVFKKFIEEFSNAETNLDYSHNSILQIERLFRAVNKLVLSSENRTITTKQVNVYTLNYDEIVENVLIKIGVLNNVVSSSNIDNHDKFFDLVGYNYTINKYIPTYLVSKIHGDIKNPILPNRKKFDDTLEAKRFEILFKMKSQLMRINSILFVIGYSGNDSHINRLLKDCVSSGLTIYWFRYNPEEELPYELVSDVITIDQLDTESPEDTSKICATLLEEIWQKQLEE